MLLPLLLVAISLTGAVCESHVGNGLIKKVNGMHRQTHRKSSEDYVDFLKTFNSSDCNAAGLQRMKGYIYVLCLYDSIRVYANRPTFPYRKTIRPRIEGYDVPSDLAVSVASNSLYVYSGSCIFEITGYGTRTWLCNLARVNKITVSKNGDVVVLTDKFYVKVYSPDAVLQREIEMKFIKDSMKSDSAGRMVILKPNGEYISVQFAYGAMHYFYAIGLLTPDGDPTSDEVSVSTDRKELRKTDSCWSFLIGLDATDLGTKCFEPRPDVYMLVEGYVFKVGHSSGQDNRIIVLDVQTSFGTYPTDNKLTIHEIV